jgi:hypothetical protein
LIYIIIDEPFEEVDPAQLIQHLTTDVFGRLGVENLSNGNNI